MEAKTKTNILIITLHVFTVILILSSFVLIKNYFSTQEQIAELNRKFDSFVEAQQQHNEITGDLMVNTNYYLGRLVGDEILPAEEEPKPVPEPNVTEPEPQPAPAAQPVQEKDIFISEDADDKIKSSVVTIYAGNKHGSGFIVTEYGHILTNYHIVRGHKLIEVDFHDGNVALARVSDTDMAKDLAIVRVISVNLDYLGIASPSNIISSQEIAAFGHPNGFRNITFADCTVTDAQFSDRHFRFSIGEEFRNSGMDGAPLVNSEGKVVGMITNATSRTAIYSEQLAQIINSI